MLTLAAIMIFVFRFITEGKFNGTTTVASRWLRNKTGQGPLSGQFFPLQLPWPLTRTILP